MYPKTEDQKLRWLSAVSLEEKDFIPAYGCCEVVTESDGIIHVQKPTASSPLTGHVLRS